MEIRSWPLFCLKRYLTIKTYLLYKVTLKTFWAPCQMPLKYFDGFRSPHPKSVYFDARWHRYRHSGLFAYVCLTHRHPAAIHTWGYPLDQNLERRNHFIAKKTKRPKNKSGLQEKKASYSLTNTIIVLATFFSLWNLEKSQDTFSNKRSFF